MIILYCKPNFLLFVSEGRHGAVAYRLIASTAVGIRFTQGSKLILIPSSCNKTMRGVGFRRSAMFCIDV